jgi:hypothetical protein
MRRVARRLAIAPIALHLTALPAVPLAAWMGPCVQADAADAGSLPVRGDGG